MDWLKRTAILTKESIFKKTKNSKYKLVSDVFKQGISAQYHSNVCSYNRTGMLGTWICIYAIYVFQSASNSHRQRRQKMVDILGYFFDGVYVTNNSNCQHHRDIAAILFWNQVYYSCLLRLVIWLSVWFSVSMLKNSILVNSFFLKTSGRKN